MSLTLLFLLFIVLLLSGLMSLVHMIIRQLRNKVDITTYSKDGLLCEMIVTVNHSSNKVAEAHFPGGAPSKAIGRICVDNTAQKGVVQILTSPIEDDSSEPIYKRCGYIGQDGFIYRQFTKTGPAVRVGYVAQPSNPDKPCQVGERSWRTLWLHAYLDVYMFKPGVSESDITKALEVVEPAPDEPSPEATEETASEGIKARRNQSGLTREEIIEDICDHMVLVEGSTFRMGTPAREDATDVTEGKERGMAEENESPVHEVTLTDYYIGRYPVTQAEWNAIMGENPSDCKDDLNFPVAPVSMDMCKAFIQRLNELSGKNFSLPTEAQWEFAARGGKLSNNTVFSGSEKFSEVGWADHKHVVGTKKANELGIFDMSGLVREWCSDIWGHYSAEPQFNPYGPSENDPLVVRNTEGELCFVVRSPSGNETVTNRKGETPELSKDFKSYGIRLAMNIALPTEETTATPEPEQIAPEVVETVPEVVESVPEVVETAPELVEEAAVEAPEVVEEATVEEAPEVVEATPEVVETAPEVVEEAAEVVSEPEAPIVLNAKKDKTGDKEETVEEGDASDNEKAEGKEKSDDKKDDKKADKKAGKKKDDKKEKKPGLSSLAIRIAHCDRQGLNKASVGNITSESRAGAYALFARLYQKRDYREYFSDATYGWKDTAFLAAIVYSVLYIAYYLVMCCVLQRPIVGPFIPHIIRSILGLFMLYAFYFIVWVFVRSIKVERIESGNSFQPQLNLLNKMVGQNNIELAIIIMGVIALGLSYTFFDSDFMPLIFAILTGTLINRMVDGVSRPWFIRKSYNDKNPDEIDEEAGELDTNQPPAGDIICTYDWDLDCDGKTLHGNLSINFDNDQMKEERQNNPFFAQSSLHPKDLVEKMFNMLLSRRDYMERVNYLAKSISSIAERGDLSEAHRVQFVLDFIQEPNIKFVMDKDSERIQYNPRYMRLPDETLLDKEGDYDCKAFLASMLYHALGYDVLFLYSSKHDHYAIAVEELYSWTDTVWAGAENKHAINFQNRRFTICETATDRFTVGDLLPGILPEDFDTRIYLPSDEEKETFSDYEDRTYDWNLDSEDKDLKIHGMVVLQFNSEAIVDLRAQNPFKDYGSDGHTYEQNVRQMVEFLLSKPQHTENLNKIARVIKDKTANVSELNMIQFALDFVQEPNIRYCLDEQSVPIANAKEYMRFPDEILFDKEGDCDCKSFLAAMLFKALGKSALFLMSKQCQHAAVAVECTEEWVEQIPDIKREQVVKEYNGKMYMYCETTSDGFKVGHIQDGESIHAFDGIVEI